MVSDKILMRQFKANKMARSSKVGRVREDNGGTFTLKKKKEALPLWIAYTTNP